MEFKNVNIEILKYKFSLTCHILDYFASIRPLKVNKLNHLQKVKAGMFIMVIITYSMIHIHCIQMYTIGVYEVEVTIL